LVAGSKIDNRQAPVADGNGRSAPDTLTVRATMRQLA
jgi:hypothetical protein